MTDDERAAFIRRETRVHPVPHAPELRLHLADEAVPLWRRTEEELAGDDVVEGGLPPPYWAFAWAGGQGLARWALDHPGDLAGRVVIDVASGSGLVGIAAARAGAAHVTCVDVDPFCAVAARLNAALNGVRVEVLTEDVTGRPRAALGSPDLVLVGDVHYDRRLAEAMTPWLEGLAGEREGEGEGEGARVLVGDPGRAYFPRARGWREVARYEVPVMRDLEDAAMRSVAVWEVAPPR